MSLCAYIRSVMTQVCWQTCSKLLVTNLVRKCRIDSGSDKKKPALLHDKHHYVIEYFAYIFIYTKNMCMFSARNWRYSHVIYHTMLLLT